MENSAFSNLFRTPKEKTVEIKDFSIQGNLLKLDDIIIQISNISLITALDVRLPDFPLWVLAVALVGVILLAVKWFIGLFVLAVACLVIYTWYKNVERAKEHKYLNLLLNSGYTYAILFQNGTFLQEVLQIFANIFEDGVSTGTNYYIDMNGCKIDNNSSVVSTIGK